MLPEPNMIQQLMIVNKEKVVSVRDVQRNPSAVLQGLTRIVKNGKTLGFFLNKEEWEELKEDMEALSSPQYLQSIRDADEQIMRGETVPIEQVMKEYGIRGGVRKKRS